MEQLYPSILINGAVVILLWSLVWRFHAQRLAAVENETAHKVDRELCLVQHQRLSEDIQEIKKNQEKMFALLEEVRMRLARENGRQSRPRLE